MPRISFGTLSRLFPAACCLFLFALTPSPLYAGGGDAQMQPTQNMAENQNMKTLATSVFYRERMMLPPGSTLTVTLEDVSKMDVAADIITYKTLSDIRTPPYDVELQYDPEAIKKRMRYAVRARIENSGQLLFTNTEHINPFAGDPGKPVEILVRRVGSGQKPAAPDASLQNTYWKLMKLAGRDAKIGADGKELSMVFTSDENRVRGYAGCNNFNGSYSVEKSKVGFSQLAVTMRMCMDSMDQEKAFLNALEKTVKFAISGERLTLFDEADQPVAEFESRYLQ